MCSAQMLREYSTLSFCDANTKFCTFFVSRWYMSLLKTRFYVFFAKRTALLWVKRPIHRPEVAKTRQPRGCFDFAVLYGIHVFDVFGGARISDYDIDLCALLHKSIFRIKESYRKLSICLVFFAFFWTHICKLPERIRMLAPARGGPLRGSNLAVV